LLRITASVTFGQLRIVPLLPQFTRLYPELKLECIFTDANLDLVDERIDLAVRLAPTIEGDLVATKLMQTRYRVVASPGYLGQHPPIAIPADLVAHRVLLFTMKAFRSRWLFRSSHGHIESVAVDGDITLVPAGSLLSAALSGLGPALLPNWLVDVHIARRELVDVFPDWMATATTFDTAAWLVVPPGAYLPRKVRLMMEFLERELAHSADRSRAL
jgi:DNA-binding transcriptional LysR family regulator